MHEPLASTQRWLTMDDGAQLRVLCYGSGQASPILFVAGWLSLPRGWAPVIEALTAAHPVYYLETREKDSSRLDPAVQRDFSVDRMRRDLAGSVEQLFAPDQEFLLAGSSLGATVILEYLAAGGRAPGAAALVAPNREYHFPGWSRIVVPLVPIGIYPAFREIIKFYLRNFRLDPVKEPEQYAKYADTLDCADPRKLKPNALSLMNYALPEGIADIAGDILILGGEADRLHGLDDLRWMAQRISGARLLPMASNKDTHSAAAGDVIRQFFADGFAPLAQKLDQAQ